MRSEAELVTAESFGEYLKLVLRQLRATPDGDIGSATANGSNAGRGVASERRSDGDEVGVPLRLRIYRPRPEAWVAHQPEHLRLPVVSGDQIRPRRRYRVNPDIMSGRARRNSRGEGERELREEIRVGRPQVDGHGACLSAGHDALAEVTPHSLPAALRAFDPAVVRSSGRAELKEPLKCSPKICWLHKVSVRVADPWPQLEAVGPTAVARDWEREREIRNQLNALNASHAPEANESVVRE